MPDTRPHWLQVIHSHFLLCTFLGLLVLSALKDRIASLEGTIGEMSVVEFAMASVYAGGLVAAATWLLHRLVLGRVRRRFIEEHDDHAWAREGALVGFVCGALAPFFLFVPYLLPALALAFLLLIYSNARMFLRRVAVILRPGNHPRPVDVARLVFLYGSLVASFTLLNAAIARLHPLDAPAYRGLETSTAPLIDSLYFSVVVITTLGFGDITPVTPDAKIAVVIQVGISYLLFALLIGTITRGILPVDRSGDGGSADRPSDR
ncbi:MAG: potassium channel family protein [Planctomycetota bacterium]